MLLSLPAMSALLRRREAISLIDVDLTRIVDLTAVGSNFNVPAGRAIVLAWLVEASFHATPSFLRCAVYDQEVD